MSRKTYQLQQRQASMEETRARLIAAARSKITSGDGFAAFTLDAVAKTAGVTRTTVYNQFQSKIGLLDAVCDDVAIRGGISNIDDILADPNPFESLRRYIAAFVKLYSTDRLLFKRLFAFAALDAEFGAVLSDREDRRRREGLKHILIRIHEVLLRATPTAATIDSQAILLKALLRYEVFDTLSEGRTAAKVVTCQMQEMAMGIIEYQLKIDTETQI